MYVYTYIHGSCVKHDDFKTKSTIFQKVKIAKLSNLDQNPFQNTAHLQTIIGILNDHISKTTNSKNRKIGFSFVLE